MEGEEGRHDTLLFRPTTNNFTIHHFFLIRPVFRPALLIFTLKTFTLFYSKFEPRYVVLNDLTFFVKNLINLQ